MSNGRSPIAPPDAAPPRSAIGTFAARAARAEVRGIAALAAGDLGGAHDAWEDAVRAFADAGQADAARRIALTLATSLVGAGEPFRALAWLPSDPGDGDPTPSLLRLAALAALGRYSEARPLAASLAASPLLPRPDAARAARRLVEIEGVLGVADPSPPPAAADADPEDVRLEDALAAPGGATPGEIARRAEEAGLLSLACRARMAEARAAWEAGDGRGRTPVAEASRLARASGDAALQHRVVRLAAELSLRQGADAASVVPTLRALVRRSQRARDTYGEARDRLVLARALAFHRPQAAPAEAMVALRLAQAGGYRRLSARATRLATLLGASEAGAGPPGPGDPPRTFEDRVLFAAADVATAASAGDLSTALAAWEAALEAAPVHARPPLDALCSRAFEGAGLVREGRGTSPSLLFDDRDRSVWRGGARIAAFGRGGIPYRLLLAVAAPGPRPPGREALFRAVWEQPYRPPSSDRALFTTAGRIRERLSPGAPRFEATPDGAYTLSEAASVWRRTSAPPLRAAPDTVTRPSLTLALTASLPDLRALPGFATLARAPLPRADRPFGNLVPDPDALVGRDGDLAFLEGAAGTATALTLAGPPGIGRSRLARALALRLLPDRVARGGEAWWVDAAGAEEPGALASAIAGTLGVEPGASKGETRLLAALGRALRARGPLLLVLDGVEEEAMAAEAISSLASAAPGILFIVPARACLGVPGEKVHPVGPLDAGSGRALYLARRGGEEGHEGDAARLGGIPLAIEIGAALSSANGALALPAHGDPAGARGGDEGVPGPLARVLEEAWGRLAPPERTALAALAARPARWIPQDLEGALATSEGTEPEVAESVAALRRLGLVIREPDPTGAPSLRVPEAVRTWALTRGIAPSADPPPAPHRTSPALTASAGGGEDGALLRVLDRAARAFAADGDAVGEAEAAVLMGAAHARAGRPEQARDAYARAAARAEGAGTAHLAARARLGESEAALALGDAAGALASARAALDSVAVTGDAAHEAEAAVHLCAAALDLAPDLARTWIRLALAAPPHPGTESALERLRALEARRPGR